jgi:hypothetical protein
MRAIINGVEGGKIGAYKGAALVLLVQLLNDDGTVFVCTGDTVVGLIYDTQDRRNAAIDSQAATITDGAAGFVTLTYAATDMTFGPSTNNVPYWLFIKFTDSTNAPETLALVPTQLLIK